MKTCKILLLLFFFCGFNHLINAQKVSGAIYDKATNDPIIGASIIFSGNSRIGTISNMDGQFSLDLPEIKGELKVTYLGYKSQRVKLAPGTTSYRVEMEVDAMTLEDIVVVGYGVQKRGDVTGAISSVKADDIIKAPVVSAEQAMQGRLAGVTVTSNSGAPGSTTKVSIRGLGTINNSDPLYVIDGVPAEDMTFVNPNDIETIDVLKDASATAIYGSRGANGVIMVTTKQGKTGKATISFDTYVGFSDAWKTPDLLNSQEWYSMINEARKNGGKENLKLLSPSDDLNHTTNWFDEVTRTGIVQSYNLSITGGNDVAKYSVSGGYIDNEGTVEGSSYERISARFNGDYKVKPWLKLGSNISLTSTNKNNVNENDYYYGIVYSSLKLDPITPVWDNKKNQLAASPYTDVYTPTAWNATHFDQDKNFTLFGNVYANIEFMKELNFKTNFGLDARNMKEYSYLPTYNLSPQLRNDQSVVTRNIYQPVTWVWENTLDFNKSFNEKHNLNVMIGTSAQKNNTEFIEASKKGTPGNDITLQQLAAATEGDKVTGNLTQWALLSFFGRVNYNYLGKYVLTANFRRDGSSRFGPNNKYGNFPSFSAGWVINEEEFLMGVDFLSRLKLRAGWGQIGNQNIDKYQYITTIRQNNDLSYVLGNDQRVALGAIGVVPGNPNVKWETTTSTNAGLDFGFFNGKLSGTFDYFIKKTTDMLLAPSVPYYVGWGYGGTFAKPTINSGGITNRGWELTLAYQDKINDFNYRVSANVSSVDNEVDYISASTPYITGGSLKFGSVTRTEVGHPIGAYYGYVTDGLFQSQAEADNSLQKGSAIAGDVRFKDVSGDGKLTDADRTFIGSPIPEFSYGFNIDLGYKSFDLSLFFQGVSGNDIFNSMKYDLLDDKGETWNRDREILNRWTGPGTSNKIPVLNSASKNNNLRISDFYVEDGSYLRLKTAQLGYTLPKNITSKMRIDRLRVYVTAYNLLTFTNYSGLDPEIGYTGGTLRDGVDFGTYPQSRTFNFGLSLMF